VNARQFLVLTRLGHYDGVLYIVGAGAEYAYILELIRAQRGAVWLRDIRLLPTYRSYYEESGRDASELPQELIPWTRRYPAPDKGLLLRDAKAQRREAIYMLSEITSRAASLIVGSQAESEIVRMERCGDAPVITVARERWDDDSAIDTVCWALLGQTSGTAVDAPLSSSAVAFSQSLGKPLTQGPIGNEFAVL
jgi:hypothetical protein